MNQPRHAYIHVPFCRHRCGYCNFTLIAGRDDLFSAYLAALEAEIASILGEPSPVDSIFLGGGTPSYLPPETLRQLLEIIAKWLRPSTHAEISCEMNPLDCTPERLALLRAYGVNRISLGGQSFSDSKLHSLERDHTGDQLRQILATCADYFDNLSLDLIFAAPGETMEQWQQDLRSAWSSPIKHLSTYGLTIERGSAFFGRALKDSIRELEQDLQLWMYAHAIDTLTDRDWVHYEVSNFAKPGFECQHNEAYWLGKPWWAFGPGAASFLSKDGKRFVRSVNHRSTTTYIRRQLAGQPTIAEQDDVSFEQYIRERLVFGLRRLAGVNLDALSSDWNAPVRPIFEPYLSRFIDQGWLSLDASQQLRLTRNGLFISDSLWPDLLTP